MKSIKLTQGKHTIVDDTDFDTLKKFKWCYDTNGYATGRVGGVKWRLHRFLMQPNSGFEIDHINGDRLDNRRKNLRLATTSQNRINTGLYKTNTSGYKGVDFYPRYEKYRARLGGKTLGYFQNLREAIEEYNFQALITYGEYARLNKF